MGKDKTNKTDGIKTFRKTQRLEFFKKIPRGFKKPPLTPK